MAPAKDEANALQRKDRRHSIMASDHTNRLRAGGVDSTGGTAACCGADGALPISSAALPVISIAQLSMWPQSQSNIVYCTPSCAFSPILSARGPVLVATSVGPAAGCFQQR